MCRALLSGNLSVREATQKLSSVPMVELLAADNLIGHSRMFELVEAVELSAKWTLGSLFAWKAYMEFAVIPAHPRRSELEDSFDSWQMVACHTGKHNPPSSSPAKF